MKKTSFFLSLGVRGVSDLSLEPHLCGQVKGPQMEGDGPKGGEESRVCVEDQGGGTKKVGRRKKRVTEAGKGAGGPFEAGEVEALG